MRLLALDTTTRAGSAALVTIDDRGVFDVRRGDASRSHGERLPSELITLVDAHSLTTADIDVFAVASGPGSFTGLRIGIATMQGLALVHGRPIAGVSALEALAQLAGQDRASGTRIGVWMDAHRGDVFSALYDLSSEPPFSGRRLIEVEGAAVGAPSATLARWLARDGAPAVVVGDGAERYGEHLARSIHGVELVPAPLLAGAIAQIAADRARGGGLTTPAGIQPLYVRRPDAEIDREKRVHR